MNGYPTIHHNSIQNNDGYALYNTNSSGGSSLNAENNWWGTAVNSEIQTLIFDWNDDANYGMVDYIPYLQQASPVLSILKSGVTAANDPEEANRRMPLITLA